MKRRIFIGGTAALVAYAQLARVARAEEHVVEMLNKGPDGQRNWFEPALIRVEPGDTITFKAVDKGHNSASIEVPEGAEEWKGKINQDVQVTVQQEGLYAYKCTPHFGLGMVGLIVVGDPSVNLEVVEKQKYPGKAKSVMADLLEQVKTTT
jgi:pseudoazurin